MPKSVCNGRSQAHSDEIGIWRLGSQFHTGAFATLWHAQPVDAKSNSRFDYILRLSVTGQNAPESLAQIRRFCEAAAATSHPNIVPVLDAGRFGQQAYLVMPRLDGVTMMAPLTGNGEVPLPIVLWWVRQLAQGLDALNQAGWVHHDVKPENVIIAENGHASLVDLGFAIRSGTAPAGVVQGSKDYLAPELMSGSVPVQPSADIFSLGRLLWKFVLRVNVESDRWLAPVVEVLEQMIDDDPRLRPSAEEVAKHMLRLEIETLGGHIRPQARCRVA